MPRVFDSKLSLLNAKKAIEEAINHLDVADAFHHFIASNLPFNTVISGKYSTALHKLIAFRAFDHVRGFLRLIKDSPSGREHLVKILGEDKGRQEGLGLSDFAAHAFFQEVFDAERSGLKDLGHIKRLAAMVHFFVKFTGVLPDRLPAFKNCSEEKKTALLTYFEKNYFFEFSERKRAKWEEEFDVLAHKKASSIAPSC